MSKKRVFVDTNIILEAFRINCWSEICNTFSIETVEKCREECLTGNQVNPNYTAVDKTILDNNISACHTVTNRMVATLVFSKPECQGLDDGELHLLAFLYASSDISDAGILISTADKAAILSTHHLGWLDYVECLEKLMNETGVTKSKLQALKEHFRSKWLSNLKTKIKLNTL